MACCIRKSAEYRVPEVDQDHELAITSPTGSTTAPPGGSRYRPTTSASLLAMAVCLLRCDQGDHS